LKSTIKLIETKSKRLKLKNAPAHEVVSFFIRGILNGSINTRATSIAFHFFMAMLPGIVFLFSLAPLLPFSGISDASISIMDFLLPEQTRYSIVEIITGFVGKSGKLQVFSIFIAFMFSMNGVNGVISAFNSTYHTIETRSWMQKRKISVVLVGILFVLFFMALCLIIVSEILIDFLIAHAIVNKLFTVYLLHLGKWLSIFFLILMTTSFTYYLAPADKKNWKFISVGSVFASILTVMASLVFTFVMNKFGKFNLFFGPAGTLMVVMLWTYFNALALLLGFEFNASIHIVSQTK
jgi:membrane protein